jgi:Nif-specific regulatory protein
LLTSYLNILEQFAGLLAESDDPRGGIRTAIRYLDESLGAGFAALILPDTDSSDLRLAEASGLSAAEFRSLDKNAGNDSILKVLDSKSSCLLTDGTLEQLFPPSQKMPANAVLAVPSLAGNVALGVLLFGKDSVDYFSSEIQKLLSICGSLIAQSLRVERSIRGERERLRAENLLLKQELKEKYDFSQLVGKSSAMKLVFEQVTQVAKSNATVLLRGESGTGKELVASAIHYNSLRAKGPFVRVNCAALPESLIESELFGHEKGAFTGADRMRRGRIESADGGTLFLDEVGDIPLSTQVKLLRVLQEREFERVGSSQTLRANFRLIAATNKDLENAISQGHFREDLYYRLNVFTIFLPPLRERRSDILLLAEHFIEKYEREYNKRIRRISTPAIDMLMSYHFPGNVRELENAIERAVIACDTNVIHSHHLPPTLQTAEVSGTVTDVTLSSAVASYEKGIIQDALKSSGGNVAKAARSLSTTERILGYKIRKYAIDPRRFRK